MKIGVLLAGSGVFDGSEIHEATFTLLGIDEAGHEAVCFAPNVDQHHVVNHTSGEEMNETRNVLVESARITRGNIKSLDDVKADDLDALFIPGGFGAAKNINQWALKGPEGEINPQVKQLILDMVNAKKPVAGVCMGPTVIAKALEGSGIQADLTPGTTEEKSPYDIKGIADGMESIGAKAVMKTVREVAVDEKNKIVTAPCYNMEATISEIHKNVKMAVNKLVELASK